MITALVRRVGRCGWVLLGALALVGCKDGESKSSSEPDGKEKRVGETSPAVGDPPEESAGLTVTAGASEPFVFRAIVSPFSIRGDAVAFGRHQACSAVFDLKTGELDELPCTKPLTLPIPRLQRDHVISFSTFKDGEIYARPEYGRKLGDFDAQNFAGASDEHIFLREGDSLSARPLAAPTRVAWKVDMTEKKAMSTNAGLIWMDANDLSTSFGTIDEKGRIETIGAANGHPNGFVAYDGCPIVAAYWDGRDKPRWQYEFFDVDTGTHVHSGKEPGLISDLACNDESIGYLVWNSLQPSQLVMVDRASGDVRRSDLPKNAGYNGKVVMADVLLHPTGTTLYRFEEGKAASSKTLPMPMADQLHGAEIWITHGRLLWSARQIFMASDGADPTKPRVSVYDLGTDEVVFDETYDLRYKEIGPIEFWAYGDEMRVIIQGRLRQYSVGKTAG